MDFFAFYSFNKNNSREKKKKERKKYRNDGLVFKERKLDLYKKRRNAFFLKT